LAVTTSYICQLVKLLNDPDHNTYAGVLWFTNFITT